MKAKYQRILLKLSGETLKNEDNGEPIDGARLHFICQEIKKIYDLGIEIGIVIGGGNIFRGLSGATSKGVDRTTGDFMGMLSTMINGMALMDCLEKMGLSVRIQSALPMRHVASSFVLRKAIRHLQKGRIVIFVAGTGNPYFSTDTTAALRGAEIGAEVILKATKVDGIYNADPVKNPQAIRWEKLSFNQALQERLKVMDSTAFSLCMDNHLPILVFSLYPEGNILKAVCGENIGTLVS